jgi:hypothetical protein
MRTITCLFFGVVTLLLGNIRAGVGQPTDAVPPVAALVFVIAAIAFAVIDWPGLPTTGVEVPAEDRVASRRRTARATSED